MSWGLDGTVLSCFCLLPWLSFLLLVSVLGVEYAVFVSEFLTHNTQEDLEHYSRIKLHIGNET